MPFEFDTLKSAANKAKHGIDFSEANESRLLIVGQIKQAVWTATVTYRNEEAIRIISVRRARDDEKARYVDAPERRR